MISRLSAVGYKNHEIAEMLGLSQGHISVVLSDPRAQIDIADAVDRVSDNIVDLHTRIKAHAVEALDDIVHTLRHSKDEKLRTKVGFGILDRAGYTPIQKHMEVKPELPTNVADRVESAMREVADEVHDAEYEYVHEDYDSGEDVEVESD